MIAMLDFGYMSELATRYSVLLALELSPFLEDMYVLFQDELLNWYNIGFRFGMLWKMLFDIKITA